MALNEVQETIVPLIKLSRKLQRCDAIQLEEWFGHFANIFQENNSSKLFAKILSSSHKLLMNILLNGLSQNHSIIPTKIYDELLYISPSEKALSINDSISKSDIFSTKSHDEIAEKAKLTFLKIPKVLKIETFTFLEHKDLCRVQRVCRSVNIAARDPNSVYCLDPNHENAKINYSHPWYSKIKSLEILKATKVMMQNKWYQTVRHLDIHQDATSNLKDTVESFNHLETLNLHCYETGFIQHITNYAKIRGLDIKCGCFDNEILMKLSNCVNLQSLKLESWAFRIEPVINDTTKLDQNDNSFRNLTDIDINIGLFERTLPLFYWIITNHHQKTLKLGYRTYPFTAVSQIFDPHSKDALSALHNVQQLSMDLGGGQYGGDHYTTYWESVLMNLSNSLKSMDESQRLESIHIDKYDYSCSISTKLVDLFGCIAKYCPLTTVSLKVEHFDDDSKIIPNWMSNIFNSGSKSFRKLDISIESEEIRDRQRETEQELVQFYNTLEENALNRDRLQMEGRKMGLKVLNEYNKILKPWISKVNKEKMREIGMKSICFEFIVCFTDFMIGFEEPDAIMWNEECYDDGGDLLEAAVEEKMEMVKMAMENGFIQSVEETVEEGVDERCEVYATGCYEDAIDILFNIELK